MKGAYIISDDTKDGDGIRVTIENGKFICEVSDGGGNYGGTWFCDIELLRYHIERYKEGLQNVSGKNRTESKGNMHND